jgi:PAS domain S-box-containing protein
VDTIPDSSGNPLCKVLTHLTYSEEWDEKSHSGIPNDRIEKANKAEQNSEHQALVEGIIEQSLFAISISDSSGTLVKANKKFREYLCLSNEELLGKYNILDDANLIENGVIPKVKSVFENLKPVRFNILCRKPVVRDKFQKGNRFVWIHVFAYPVVDNYGDLKNVVFQWIDMNDNNFIDEIFNRNEEISRNIYRKGHSIVF